VLDLRETLLRLLLTGRQVALGLLAALGEVRLEVGGGLRGLGAGLLEEGVGLLALLLRSWAESLLAFSTIRTPSSSALALRSAANDSASLRTC